MTKDSV